MRRSLLVVLAALVAATLAIGLVAVGVDGDGDDDTARPGDDAATTPSTAPAAPATHDAIDAAVESISQFVADARELEFEHDVDVALLGDDEFAKRIEQDAVEDLAELTETEDVLVALGLLEPDDDLAAVLRGFLGDAVVGFYDPETDELVVRGAALTPYVRVTLAHELTHALDDQHFDIEREALDDADDESAIAFSALVEGNALRIEDEYRMTLSADERSRLAEEEARLAAAIDLTAVPRVVPELIGFPYALGPALVDALVDEGGEQRVNEAFAAPPVTTEQVINPQSWLDGDNPPVAVDPPPADGEVFDQGVIGLWGIVVLLGEELGQAEAFAAAEGWGGDWYVAWRDGDRTCVRATFVMDGGRDLDQVAEALDEWAVAQDDAELERGDDQVTFTACA